MVVVAAISTGRVLGTALDSITAIIGNDSFPALHIYFVQRVQSTFLITIPNNPNQPAIKEESKSNPVKSIPTATPIMDSGRTHRIMTGSRKLPNKATRITTNLPEKPAERIYRLPASPLSDLCIVSPKEEV